MTWPGIVELTPKIAALPRSSDRERGVRLCTERDSVERREHLAIALMDVWKRQEHEHRAVLYGTGCDEPHAAPTSPAPPLRILRFPLPEVPPHGPPPIPSDSLVAL